MKDWSAGEIARAAGARLLAGGAEREGALGASVDSRSVGRGDLFVGLQGERSDGGAHAPEAIAAGAWGALVSPAHSAAAVAAAAALAPAEAVVLEHESPLRSLQTLARARRRALAGGAAKVVAVTGSTGKTSTKEILVALLHDTVRTSSSRENLNTEIGLPLAILAAAPDTEVLVLEMAMRGAGQIAELTEIAQPDVGVIVNVGPAHLELLGSLDAIAAAKAELIAGLSAGMTAVVPADEPLLEPFRRADLDTITFGAGGDVRLSRKQVRGEAIEVVISSRGREVALELGFSQPHQLQNLLAAVAAAGAVGVQPGGRIDVNFGAMRGERVATPVGAVLINDCYNANPMSMRAAIDELAAAAPGRRVAVLGDMLELGEESLQMHRAIGQHASDRGIDVLVTVGPLAAHIGETFDGEVHAVPDADAAARALAALVRADDTVLVKGSRGVALERVVRALAAPASHDPETAATR
jgi:UDP-N-acetylmuramoyl-tripeptide--D-alanyl-D-alanine ligase